MLSVLSLFRATIVKDEYINDYSKAITLYEVEIF